MTDEAGRGEAASREGGSAGTDEEGGSAFPPVREVGFGAPLRWLALGWRDLVGTPRASLFYGVAFAAMGWVLNWVVQFAPQFSSALTGGFLLLGPVLATGLYEISRRREQGKRVDLWPTLSAWRANAGAIGVFTVMLAIVMLVWARASLVTFALFFDGPLPDLGGFFSQVATLQNLEFLAIYFAVGALFATIVYAASVVAIPMMLDRGTDAVVAALTSVRALFASFATLIFWALLIVILIGAGFLTLHLGLVLTAPLIGHATWHAYREIVG